MAGGWDRMLRFLRQIPVRLALVSAALVYVVTQFFIGQQSVIAWVDLTREHAVLQAQAQALAEERTALEAQVRRLALTGADADVVEERAYHLLGFADPRDFVVALPKSQTSAASPR